MDLSIDELAAQGAVGLGMARTSAYLTHPVFNSHHSETEMLRYIFQLQAKDLSLTHSMIPLGSCTMKLNATSEMLPVTWPEFASSIRSRPRTRRRLSEIFTHLEKRLAEITGLPACPCSPTPARRASTRACS